MRHPRRRLALALLAGLALAGCNKAADAAGGANGSGSGVFTASEYVMGDPKAKVTVVEYLSDTCSHCARFDREAFPTIKKDYIDTGKVQYRIREFLTPPEAVSAAGFAMARCAGRDKYWPVIEALFRSQDELFRTGDVKTIFNRIGASAGLSPERVNTCVRDDKILGGIADRVQKAMDQDKIQGTPTLIVNGQRYENEMDLPQTRAALDKALAAAR
jgi:protein-disulfide isomerase